MMTAQRIERTDIHRPSLEYLYETNKSSALHWRKLANAAAKSGDSRASVYRELSRQQAEFAREVLGGDLK